MVLLTGSTGFIGSLVPAALRARGVDVAHIARPTRAELDLAQPDRMPFALDRLMPRVIVHCAAMRDLAQCEREPELAVTVNVHATAQLATWASRHGARVVYLSTDQVFDGTRGLYREDDPRRPINHYGMTKALGEDAALACPGGVVARIALTLGHTRERTRSPNEFVVSNLRAGKPATLYENEFRTPILVDDAAAVLAELATMPAPPRVVHVGGPERLSRVEMGRGIASGFGLPLSLCHATRHVATPTGLQRPLDTSMDTRLLRQISDAPPRSFEAAVRELVATEPHHPTLA